MYEFCNKNCKLGGNIYADHTSKDTVILAILNREIGQYFAITPDKSKKAKLDLIVSKLYDL
jgi:hypothetical protein